MQAPNPCDADSLWVHPPAFFLERLIRHLVITRLNWRWYIARMRLVSREWRRSVDGCMPVLCPRSELVNHCWAAAVLPAFVSLSVLRLRITASTPTLPQATRQLLASITSTTTLQRLSLRGWADEPTGPQIGSLLAPLVRLRHLEIVVLPVGLVTRNSWTLDELCTLLYALHQLESLALRAQRFTAAAVRASAPAGDARLEPCHTSLTSLSLQGAPSYQLWPTLLRLTGLRHLALEAPDVEESAADFGGSPKGARLSLLTALSHLTRLSLSNMGMQAAHAVPGVLTALPALRVLALGAPDDAQVVLPWQPATLPLAACARLESLSVAVGLLQLPGALPSQPFAESLDLLGGLRSLSLDFRSMIEAEDEGPGPNALLAGVCRACSGLKALRLDRDVHAVVSEGTLARVSQLTALTSLDIANMADCADTTIVRISQKLHRLQRLRLHRFMEQDGAMFRLTSLTNLTRLVISRPHLMSGPQLYKRLCHLSQLRWLTLDHPEAAHGPGGVAANQIQLLDVLPGLQLLEANLNMEPQPFSTTNPVVAALLARVGPRLRALPLVEWGDVDDEDWLGVGWREFEPASVLGALAEQ